MKYKNPLIIAFEGITSYSPDIQQQLDAMTNAALLADSGKIDALGERSIIGTEEGMFVVVIRAANCYRVLHIYDEHTNDVLIGISTEVEQ